MMRNSPADGWGRMDLGGGWKEGSFSNITVLLNIKNPAQEPRSPYARIDFLDISACDIFLIIDWLPEHKAPDFCSESLSPMFVVLVML